MANITLETGPALSTHAANTQTGVTARLYADYLEDQLYLRLSDRIITLGPIIRTFDEESRADLKQNIFESLNDQNPSQSASAAARDSCDAETIIDLYIATEITLEAYAPDAPQALIAAREQTIPDIAASDSDPLLASYRRREERRAAFEEEGRFYDTAELDSSDEE